MNIDQAIYEYIHGASLAEIQRKFNIKTIQFKRILTDKNIKIRSAKEQTIFTNQNRRKNVKDDIFSEYNRENMWLAGFIASDGTIRKTRNEIKIGLSRTDREILEKIKTMLEVEREIHDYETSNGFQVSELVFSSKTIKDKLFELGIYSNKTYLPMSMEKVPEEFKINFILGYFDGDGSISFNKNTKQIAIKIISYNKNILEEISEYLNTHFQINSYIYLDKRRKSLFSLKLSTTSSLKLCELFYETENISSKIFLNRKYKKYLEIKNKRI